MILLETIHNAHRQLGRAGRPSEIEALLTKKWHKLHPEAQGWLGREPFERILNQAYRQAEKQIINEETNDPIRALA